MAGQGTDTEAREGHFRELTERLFSEVSLKEEQIATPGQPTGIFATPAELSALTDLQRQGMPIQLLRLEINALARKHGLTVGFGLVGFDGETGEFLQ